MIKGKRILIYVVLTIVSIVSAFPLYYMLVSATNTSQDVVKGTLIPGTQLITNFKVLSGKLPIGRGLWNSLRNALLQTGLSILVNSIAGYAFEIYHDKWKDRVMTILLLTMMVPFISVLIPLFTMFSRMKMINTLWALLLPSLSSAMFIMMFRQAAKSFPLELIEAARLDGISEIGIFFKIFIPTMKSTFAAALTISFMGSWNNYMWPLVIFTKTENKTMTLLVPLLYSSTGKVDYAVNMLGVAITTIPTALIFLFLQKNFAEGITGSVKG